MAGQFSGIATEVARDFGQGQGANRVARASQIAAQTERLYGVNKQLAELVTRLDQQMSSVQGAEPQPGAENGNKMPSPGCALDSLGAAISEMENLVTRLHHQVERVERL